MTRHFRDAVYPKYDGTPTNQCRCCGARYSARETRCPFHADVEVWVRGALVRFWVILWPAMVEEDRLPTPEAVGCEMVGATHARSYNLMSTEYGALTDAEMDAVYASFWDQEEFDENCHVFYWEDSYEQLYALDTRVVA